MSSSDPHPDAGIVLRLGAPIFMCPCGQMVHLRAPYWYILPPNIPLGNGMLGMPRRPLAPDSIFAELWDRTVGGRYCSEECGHKAAISLRLTLYKRFRSRFPKARYRIPKTFVMFTLNTPMPY